MNNFTSIAGASPLLDETPQRSPDEISWVEHSSVVAANLRQSLQPIVATIAGKNARPAVLARNLGIDKTLAARVVRSLRSGDTATFLHEIPAPHGLRIFLDAADRAGVDAGSRARGAECIREFEVLIGEFPGGRSALDAALAGLSPAVAGRTERNASHSICKAMGSLLGYQADTTLLTIIVRPSADDPLWCDVAYIMGKYKVRRLRNGSPITVFGIRLDLADAGGRIETMDGRVGETRPDAYLLPAYCSRPIPSMKLFPLSRNLHIYALPSDAPQVNEPVTIVAGQVTRRTFRRYRGPENKWAWEAIVPRIPSRTLIFDVFLHEEIALKSPPVVTTALHGLVAGGSRPDDPKFQLDRVDLSSAMEPLEIGGSEGDGAIEGVLPRYDGLMTDVFTMLGTDASQFTGHRCHVRNPIPLVLYTAWLELPDGP